MGDTLSIFLAAPVGIPETYRKFAKIPEARIVPIRRTKVEKSPKTPHRADSHRFVQIRTHVWTFRLFNLTWNQPTFPNLFGRCLRNSDLWDTKTVIVGWFIVIYRLYFDPIFWEFLSHSPPFPQSQDICVSYTFEAEFCFLRVQFGILEECVEGEANTASTKHGQAVFTGIVAIWPPRQSCFFATFVAIICYISYFDAPCNDTSFHTCPLAIFYVPAFFYAFL